MSLPFLPGSYVLGYSAAVEEEPPVVVTPIAARRVSSRSRFVWEEQRAGRAIVAQLKDLIGERPTGVARVVATGAPVSLPANAYAIPIIEGNESSRKLVKTGFNPVTAEPHRIGGAWPVTSTGTLVAFRGNVGGEWDVPVGSQLRFSPPIVGIAETAEVTTAIEGGTNSGELARSIVLYDDFDNAPDWEMFRAEASDGPVVVIAWLRSTPVEGRSGFSPGASSQGRARRLMFKDWIAIVVSSSSTSFGDRWSKGMALHESVAALLHGRKRNDDGEQLTYGPRGIEVLEQTRTAPDNTTFSAFRVSFRTMGGRDKIDPRVFPPWLWTRIGGAFGATPGSDPPHNEPLPLFETTDPMVQDNAILGALSVTDGQTEGELRAALGWTTPLAITPHLEGMAGRDLVHLDGGRWWLGAG